MEVICSVKGEKIIMYTKHVWPVTLRFSPISTRNNKPVNVSLKLQQSPDDDNDFFIYVDIRSGSFATDTSAMTLNHCNDCFRAINWTHKALQALDVEDFPTTAVFTQLLKVYDIINGE